MSSGFRGTNIGISVVFKGGIAKKSGDDISVDPT